jgi:iron complex outermembrane receptor protein
VSLDGKVGNTSYSLDSSYYDTNGFRQQNHERIKSAGFSVMMQEYADWDLYIAGGITQNTIGSPSARIANDDRDKASRPEDYTEYRERYLVISPRYWFNDNVNLEVTMTRREGEYDSVLSGGKRPRFKIYDTGISPKLTVVSDFGAVSNTFITGFDWTHSKSTFRQERNRRSFGYYFYNTMGFFDDTLFFDAGYRKERTRINIARPTAEFTPETMDAYTLGLTWNYMEGSKLYASFDRSFRFQRVDELGGTAFNQPLPHQDTKTYQAGIQHRFNQYLTLSANYFVIETENEIFFDSTAPGFFGQNTSYGETSREGFELEAKVYPTDNLMLYANYTQFDGRLLKDDLTNDMNDGNKIPGIPEKRASAGFSLDFLERFNLTAGGRWIDGYVIRSDYSNTRSGDNGYMVWDGKLTWTWKWLQVYGGCSNIFDKTYNSNNATFGVYPAPGREFFGGVNLTFEL